MQLTGKLLLVRETQQVSDRFKKREFVLNTDLESPYPQEVLLQLNQDKVGLLDSLRIGDEITCSINVRGKKWTNKSGEDKYFNSIECWRIQAEGGNTVKADKVPFAKSADDMDSPPF